MLKVGIIGLGGIAHQHCKAIAGLPNAEVAAVADLFEDKRREFMEQYGVSKGYKTHTELLKDDDIDVVAVVLGHQLHHRLTVDACRAGKHVLVEKPMALSLEHCDEMIEAAEANGVKLMVGHTHHFLGSSLKAKEILDSGELGPLITAVSFFNKGWTYSRRRPQYRSRFHGGGMWMANGVHAVDRMMWVMASQAVSVSAAIGTRAHYQAADDSATAFVRCKNGLAGVTIAVGYADGGANVECQVICANGSIRFAHRGDFQGTKGYVRIGRDDRWEDVPFDEPPTLFHNEWGGFVEAIEKDIEPPSSGEWGRHIMEILFAAEESAISGRDVSLAEGHRWTNQTSGRPVATEHGWI